jgi:hypothetical protein
MELFDFVLAAKIVVVSLVLTYLCIVINKKFFQKPSAPTVETLQANETTEEKDNNAPYKPGEVFFDDYVGPFPKCVCGAENKKMIIYESREREDCNTCEYQILTCPECRQILPAIRNS